MKKIVIVILALAFVAGLSYAAEKQPKATEPVGAVVETTGVFVGKIVGAAERATTGSDKITVQSDTGETRVFPFDQTVKVLDTSFHALTLNQLNPGEKVTVEYSKTDKAQKAKTIKVAK
ncbi:MAG: hypothetical protein PHP46_00990 [Candidatus Omnitrophica bacterium]|nr:hypothetical protein [Candidatus Omnitrophota bacterium]